MRIALADDDVLLREGLASLLERAGSEVVGQAGGAAGLLSIVRDEVPDVAIIDIHMPPSDSIEGNNLARMIRRVCPDIGIVVLSADVELEEAMELLAGGSPVGCLLKQRVNDVDDFLDTVGRVARGGSVVDPSLLYEMARRRVGPLDALTPREREVLALMADGRSNAGIGSALFVSEGTVEKHVGAILMKLDIPVAAEDHRRVLAVIAFLEVGESHNGPRLDTISSTRTRGPSLVP